MTAMLATPDTIFNSSEYLDSGATNHVTHNLNNLNLGSEYTGTNRLHMGNGAGLKIGIYHIGSSTLTAKNRSFVLNKLLRVPEITQILLSVSQLVLDSSIYFEFHSQSCFVKDQATGVILLQESLEDGLYKFSGGGSSKEEIVPV